MLAYCKQECGEGQGEGRATGKGWARQAGNSGEAVGAEQAARWRGAGGGKGNSEGRGREGRGVPRQAGGEGCGAEQAGGWRVEGRGKGNSEGKRRARGTQAGRQVERVAAQSKQGGGEWKGKGRATARGRGMGAKTGGWCGEGFGVAQAGSLHCSHMHEALRLPLLPRRSFEYLRSGSAPTLGVLTKRAYLVMQTFRSPLAIPSLPVLRCHAAMRQGHVHYQPRVPGNDIRQSPKLVHPGVHGVR